MQPVELDVKEAAAGGMGPHGLCVGATGSGKVGSSSGRWRWAWSQLIRPRS